MIFSDESGPNLTLVEPTQYEGRSHIKSDSILDFPKGPHILSISHLKYQSWVLVYTYEFQNGYVITSPANQLAKWSCYDIISQSACK